MTQAAITSNPRPPLAQARLSALPVSAGKRWWWLAWAALAGYVALRMGGFNLWAAVATPAGTIWLPNTFATVDHPFHVARADMLWQALRQGHLLRWVGQHQGGYP